ncbi:hypothetical protein EPN44_09765 [bacterium]|nr:MAG: hypothetical protein EPN44_09765 [bacterium]
MTIELHLAAALAAALCARLDLPPGGEDAVAAALAPAVAELDGADRRYRAAVRATLPAAKAEEMLRLMAAFRVNVHEVREHVRREIDAIYRRFGKTYGDFDPLDTYVPSAGGVSHADGIRAADAADRGRRDVQRLRGEVNAVLLALLTHGEVEALTVAKQERRTAFERIIETHVGSHASEVQERRRAVTELAALADGWY